MSQNTPEPSSENASPASPYTVIPVYEGLRNQVFDVYLERPVEPGVWGVVMETGFPGAIVTLVALADSTASLYFSSGGGLLGAGLQDGPGKAARSLIEYAAPFVAHCEPIQDRPLPRLGATRFYLLANGQVFSSEAPEAELEAGLHPLSPLFRLAHNLITEMRHANPNW